MPRKPKAITANTDLTATPEAAKPEAAKPGKVYQPGNNTLQKLAEGGYLYTENGQVFTHLFNDNDPEQPTKINLSELVGITANGVERARVKADPLTKVHKVVDSLDANGKAALLTELLASMGATISPEGLDALQGTMSFEDGPRSVPDPENGEA